MPPVFVWALAVSLPVAGSTAKTAMLSSPRFDAYTNLPLGCTHTSAPVLEPEKPAGSRAFLGSMGGRMRPELNPFHGFSGSTAIAEPTDADRAAVVFNKDGVPIAVATGAELSKVGEEQPPPGTADMFSHAWYFDDATETVYAFVSGGIAGFVNRMESVVRFETTPPG